MQREKCWALALLIDHRTPLYPVAKTESYNVVKAPVQYFFLPSAKADGKVWCFFGPLRIKNSGRGSKNKVDNKSG
jgi:hypothetical protein